MSLLQLLMLKPKLISVSLVKPMVMVLKRQGDEGHAEHAREAVRNEAGAARA